MRRTKTMLMGDILDEFFKRPYIAKKIAEGRLPELWSKVVGSHIAQITTELRLENHILHVRVTSSVIRTELFYQREPLKERLNTEAGVKFINAVIIR